MKFSFDLDSSKWHGKLTHISSQEASYFTDFRDLMEIITEYVPREPHIKFETDSVIDNYGINHNNQSLNNESVAGLGEDSPDVGPSDSISDYP